MEENLEVVSNSSCALITPSQNAFDVTLDSEINKDIVALSDDTPIHEEITNAFRICATVNNQVFDAALHVETVSVEGLDSSNHLNAPVLKVRI